MSSTYTQKSRDGFNECIKASVNSISLKLAFFCIPYIKNMN